MMVVLSPMNISNAHSKRYKIVERASARFRFTIELQTIKTIYVFQNSKISWICARISHMFCNHVVNFLFIRFDLLDMDQESRMANIRRLTLEEVSFFFVSVKTCFYREISLAQSHTLTESERFIAMQKNAWNYMAKIDNEKILDKQISALKLKKPSNTAFFVFAILKFAIDKNALFFEIV